MADAVLRVILFNVQHGFCAFLRSPTGLTLMIDCGKTEDFSPVEHVLKHELSGTVKHNRYSLTKLIITHPHDDHIEDIARLTSKLEPASIQRQQYNWDAIKAPGTSDDEYENLDHYKEWQKKYSQPADTLDRGMDIQTFSLSPSSAYALDKAKYVNNSSIVTVASFKGTEHSERFLFAGDVETAGWEALLKRDDFKRAISATDFYIASHHGHSSGFSAELYKAMGRAPILNLVSVHSRDENVDSRYSNKEFACGVKFGGEPRYMLSTRKDGSIFIDVNSAGKYSVYNLTLPPNLAKKLDATVNPLFD